MATDLAEEDLNPDCVPAIAKDILPVHTKSKLLGRILKLPVPTVDGIIQQYSRPEDHLFHVIDEFVKQVEPRPTWRVILDALRDPLIGLPRLAGEIERKRGFLTPKRELELQSSTNTDTAVQPYSFTTTQLCDLEAKIDELEGLFDELRTKLLNALQMNNVNVREVVYELSTLKAREKAEHRAFLKENLKILRKCDDLIALFEELNFYWNYLSPSLLEHLAKKLNCLKNIEREMQAYKVALYQFRVQAPLKVFCEIEREHVELPEGFCRVVAKFEGNISSMTLQDVEEFRMKYATHYMLRDFALMLNVVKSGSVLVSFMVPESVAEILRVNVPKDMLKEFGVTRLEIYGYCVLIYEDIGRTVAVSHETLASTSENSPSEASNSYSIPTIVPQSILATQSFPVAKMQRSLSAPEIQKIAMSTNLDWELAQKRHSEREKLRKEGWTDDILQMKQQVTELVEANDRKDRELAEYEQQLRMKENEVKCMYNEKETAEQQLRTREAELTNAEEIIKRQQHQIQEMQQREADLLQIKDWELVQVQQQLREKEVELQVSEMKMQAMRERLIVNLTMTGDSIRRNQQHILNMIQQEIELVRADGSETKSRYSQFQDEAKISISPRPADSEYFQRLTTTQPRSSWPTLLQQLKQTLSQRHMLFPKYHVKIGKIIGQGESGVVYQGYIDSGTGSELVAIKTGKALLSVAHKERILKEVSIMLSFNHTNVMSLIGMCIDREMPLLLMPFMSNGNVLKYVRSNREKLYFIEKRDNYYEVEVGKNTFLDMCCQVAKGMAHVAECKFVHRDLAARNCMIDGNGVIKVADFGLTEDVYDFDYFRGEYGSQERLPIRWMAPESFQTYFYDEKTDVWSFGVTCWEMFTCGGVPYVGVPALGLSKEIRSGYRLEKPTNAACSDEIWDIMMLCWSTDPQLRPNFSTLVDKFNDLLDSGPSYLKLIV